MTILSTLSRGLIAAVTAAALSVAPVAAQEISPDQLALARKYVDLTDSTNVYEVTVVQIGLEVMKQVTSQNPEIADTIREVVGETITTYKDRDAELLDQFARVYAQRFTMEELEQIVAFYESDAGKKLVEVNFNANQQIQQVLQIYRQNLGVEFFTQVRASLKEKGYDV